MRPTAAILAILLAGVPGCRIDHGIEPRTSAWSGIEGTVVFEGGWLAEIEEVRIAVFRTYPPHEFSDLSGFSDPLPLGVSRTPYRVLLLPGVYGWVIAAGRRAGEPWGEESLLLGQFVASPGDTVPARVTVYAHQTTSPVNLTVDFENLPERPPFPKDSRARARAGRR